MKIMKKSLAVLLAVLLAFTACGFAFADEDGWQPIAVSDEGLQDGEYYLDFSGMVHDDDPEYEAQILSWYNGGTWYFNEAEVALKGTFSVMGETQEITPEMGASLLLLILRQKGIAWVEIKSPDAELSDGDYYWDIDTYLGEAFDANIGECPEDVDPALWDALMAEQRAQFIAEEREGFLADLPVIYINAADSALFKYMQTDEDEETGAVTEICLPMAYLCMGMSEEDIAQSMAMYGMIKQYTAPEEPPTEPPTEPTTEEPTTGAPEPQSGEDGGIWTFIQNMFSLVIDLFRWFADIVSGLFK